MSQHKYKLSKILTLIFVSLAVAFALAGCRDELLYNTNEIPDAVVDVEADVIFRPLVKTEIETRADAPDGNAYNTGINSLYVFFFDKTGDKLVYRWKIEDYIEVPQESTTQKRVKFKRRVQAGEYIVIAVANIADEQKNALEAVTTMTALKNFKLNWDDSIEKNLEMFGVFKSTGSNTKPEDVTNDKFEDYDPVSILITPSQNKIHSWVRRAVSKVTIDFDGSGLKEDVTVYIKKAVLKDVASGALLGSNSWVGKPADPTRTQNDLDFTTAQSNYVITYGTGEKTGPYVTNSHTNILPSEVWEDSELQSFHDEAAQALPCYENMQGVYGASNQKHQDKNGDGIIDSYDKDGVLNGTYLEVEGYYVSDRPEYKSEGKIIYRFMLGKDADNDFDLIRNHHYQITMNFKDYGNDIDWHIVYKNRYLEATEPQDVNYRGEFFEPNANSAIPNAGHDFSAENKIIITSYETDNKSMTPVAITSIDYEYSVWNSVNNKWDDPIAKPNEGESNPDWGWLAKSEKFVDGSDNTQIEYTFTAAMSNPIAEDMNAKLKATSQGGNLGTIETANSYIVNGYGSYSIPLTYGNGNVDNPIGKNEDGTLNYPVNYRGTRITNSDILTDIGKADNTQKLEAKVVWQDANNLVTNVKLVGRTITFDITQSNIQQGNAVIALIDNGLSNLETDQPYHDVKGTDEEGNRGRIPYVRGSNTRAVWSWHIWVTRFGSDDFEKNIMVRNHDDVSYDLLPVNLGWCSGTDPVLYFPRRKCKITFITEKGDVIERTIMQYPHFALTRGDHPYYQWGRKDPFVGTNLAFGNKPRWEFGVSKDQYAGSNPSRIFNEPDPKEDGDATLDYSDYRLTTQECLKELIKNPDKWHNAPRTYVDGKNKANGFYSNNKSFDGLWGYNGKKTIYDPCPPGYRVESYDAFSGFTTSGKNEKEPQRWYDVLENNVLNDYKYTINGQEKTLKYERSVNANVVEFYADTRRLQSVPFPVTGYRDYDQKAGVLDYPVIPGVTAAVPEPPSTLTPSNGIGFVWTNHARIDAHSHQTVSQSGNSYVAHVNGTCSYHLKFQRLDLTTSKWESRPKSTIAPREDFYDTDGFAVRPVSTTQPKAISKVESTAPTPPAQAARRVGTR